MLKVVAVSYHAFDFLPLLGGEKSKARRVLDRSGDAILDAQERLGRAIALHHKGLGPAGIIQPHVFALD